MPVITISRQFGAGGKTLGRIISEKLGYALVDEDIIEKVVQEANVSPSGIKYLEEDGSLLGHITKLTSFKRFMDRSLSDKEGYIDGYKYVELLYKIVNQLAREGNVVIVGRGGQFILKDVKDVYHLLLAAQTDDRIKFMEENYKLSYSSAAQIVKNMDKRRANLYRYFKRKDYDDEINYHLVLNMSKLSLEKAAEFVSIMAKA